jgi:hypothetical protein
MSRKSSYLFEIYRWYSISIPDWYLPMFPALRKFIHPILILLLISSGLTYFGYKHHQDKVVSYNQLEKYLSKQDWRNADQETSKLINKQILVAIDNRHFWGASKIDFGAAARYQLFSEGFPCSSLNEIDKLWLKYSRNNYGFTPQSKIISTRVIDRFHSNTLFEDKKMKDALSKEINFDVYQNNDIYKMATNYEKYLGMLPSNLWVYENSVFNRSPVFVFKNYANCSERNL